MGGLQTTFASGELDPGEGLVWDRFVDTVDQSDVAQMHSWSRVRAAAGYSPEYVLIRSAGELVAGAQVLTRHLPVVGSIGYVPYGPVIGGLLEDREATCMAICEGLIAIVAQRRIRILFVQPPAGTEDVSMRLLELGFRQSAAGIAPQASLRIDLDVGVEELRGNLNKRLRSWTNSWSGRGVTVRLGGPDDLPRLADLLAKSAVHQGFEPMSLEYLERQYGELAARGSSVFFVGEVHGQAVAVDLFTSSGGMLRDRLIGMDRESEAANLSVPGAIKWHAILWAREQGLRWFDFGGIQTDLAASLVAGRVPGHDDVNGSDRFKLSFGGEAYLLPPAVELARPALLLKGYDLAQSSERGRKAVRGLRRRLRGGAG